MDRSERFLFSEKHWQRAVLFISKHVPAHRDGSWVVVADRGKQKSDASCV
jgi:hypothetical protein